MRHSPDRRLFMGTGALSLAAWLTGCKGKSPIADELERLQGHWEGEGAGGKCSITITGNSLRYCAGTTCYEATFTLPAGTNPRQLHATLTGSSPPAEDTVGAVVVAIFKIEDGTLTLGVGSPKDPPKTFDDASATYVVKRVQGPTRL